ncbi:MAG: hypothetical protein Q8O83_00705 [bacterium]|nr:hypothetical protein [bacterium]
MFSSALIAGVVLVFLVILINAWGCNPRNIKVEECADRAVLSGAVAEINHIDKIQNKKYALDAYQKKAFRKEEYVYFLRLKNTIKMDRLYFNSFYIVSAEPLSLERMQDMPVQLTYKRRCLKNFFYSAGIEGRRYRDPDKEKGLLFINNLPVLKIEKIEIIN